MFAVMVVGAFAATEYYVKTDGDDNEDGSDWAKAFKHITKALSVAHTSGDVINVKHGIYNDETSFSGGQYPILITPTHNGVTLQGVGANVLQKIVKPSGTGGVFSIIGDNDSTPVIGFTMKNLCIQDGTASGDGGGIYAKWCEDLTIEWCTIKNNVANTTSGAGGGGIYLERCGGTICECIIDGNKSMYGSGAGIYVREADAFDDDEKTPNALIIEHCCITSNFFGGYATAHGGGIYLIGNNGTATGEEEKKQDGDGTELFNNLIVKNTAIRSDGGGVHVAVDIGRCANLRLYSNTIADNTGYGLFAGDTCCTTGENNIIWDNDAEATTWDVYVNVGSLTIDYSDIDGTAGGVYPGGANNIKVDPYFESIGGDVDPYCNGYFLDRDSPGPSTVIDGGNEVATNRYSELKTPNQFSTDVAAVIDGSTSGDVIDMGYHYRCLGNTYIELDSLCAEVHAGKVVVKWETATEIDNAGFLVYRCDNEASDCHKVSNFIAADGDAVGGATYSFTDANVAAGAGYYYYLVDIDTSGEWTAHGPAFARIPNIVEPILRLPKLEALVR